MSESILEQLRSAFSNKSKRVGVAMAIDVLEANGVRDVTDSGVYVGDIDEMGADFSEYVWHSVGGRHGGIDVHYQREDGGWMDDGGGDGPFLRIDDAVVTFCLDESHGGSMSIFSAALERTRDDTCYRCKAKSR
mgnify:FL=1